MGITGSQKRNRDHPVTGILLVKRGGIVFSFWKGRKMSGGGGEASGRIIAKCLDLL